MSTGNENTGEGIRNPQSGFALAEFLISAVILLITASSVFGLISEIQYKAGTQAEAQSVLENTQLAMQVVGRYIRQAGNDPRHSGIAGITIVSPTEMRIQSDLTGSAGPQNPDKGDPDGDINDAGESITIRYNSATRSLEVVPDSGPAQVVAGSLSGLAFRYYDAGGAVISAGSNVQRVNVTVSGASLRPDPQGHRNFGIRLSSDFEAAKET